MNLSKLSALIWVLFLGACITDVAPTTQTLGTETCANNIFNQMSQELARPLEARISEREIF
jgi:hypothetical protein